MRLLVLTSRYTATRDIINENFGRQTRLFSSLRKLGHKIDFFVADYRKHENKDTELNGIRVMIRPFSIFRFFSFMGDLNNALKGRKYDFLIASSDPLWGILGYFSAKKHKIKFIYDLHDNYETYSTYKIPFFKYFDRHVIKNADIVTTVSHALKNKISDIRKKNVFVIQNGADLKLFGPMNKLQCRKALNLPKDVKIIAYTGSIQRMQGVDLVLGVFEELRKDIKNLRLVVAGRFFRNEKKYINLSQDGVIYLKSLTQDKIAKLINAADVVIVPNPKNDFTEYCFPYKVVEYMACNKPIVATRVGDVSMILKKFPDSLCKPNDKGDMKDKIKRQLKINKKNYRKSAEKNSWSNIASKLSGILR